MKSLCAITMFLSAPAWALESGVGVETNFPLDVGAVADVELPFRLGFSARVGFVPPPYIDVITTAVDDPTVTTILEQNLKSALTVGGELRGRIWSGLWFGTGFRWFGLQGGFLGCDVLELATGANFCQDKEPGAIQIDVTSQIYAMTFTLGWRLRLLSTLGLHVGISFLLGVGSSSSAELRNPQAKKALENYLDNLYKTYLKVPYLTLSATYLFD